MNISSFRRSKPLARIKAQSFSGVSSPGRIQEARQREGFEEGSNARRASGSKGSQLSAIAGVFEGFWVWGESKNAGSRGGAEDAEKNKLGTLTLTLTQTLTLTHLDFFLTVRSRGRS
ncbi:MAG: hypothetical protein ABSG59_06200 [Verrucomicrobiota bacterium]|jgi:hypothetical protein